MLSERPASLLQAGPDRLASDLQLRRPTVCLSPFVPLLRLDTGLTIGKTASMAVEVAVSLLDATYACEPAGWGG